MPWNAPFKDRSKVGIGDDQSGREVAATEVTSGCETIASGEKIGKSGREVGGGKVVKVPKVAKEKVNNSKKDARPKPSIDGLTFSVTPVKMKKVSLRGKTLKMRSFISDEEDNLEEEVGGSDKIEMTNDRGEDSFAKALYNAVGDDMDGFISTPKQHSEFRKCINQTVSPSLYFTCQVIPLRLFQGSLALKKVTDAVLGAQKQNFEDLEHYSGGKCSNVYNCIV